MAGPALCRQAPKVGARCPNWARRDLCGGCSVMDIPTAIHSRNCVQINAILAEERPAVGGWAYRFRKHIQPASGYIFRVHSCPGQPSGPPASGPRSCAATSCHPVSRCLHRKSSTRADSGVTRAGRRARRAWCIFLTEFLPTPTVRTRSLNDLRVPRRRRATPANQQLLPLFSLSWSALWSHFVRRHCDTRRDRTACRLRVRH